MSKRVTNAILATLTGATLTGAGAIAVASVVSDDKVPVTESQQVSDGKANAQQDRLAGAPKKAVPKKAVPKKAVKKQRRLPSGVSTATSFWDPATASGRPMAYRTLASPYWPLGTKVKITYRGQSRIGVVDDFGPAEWAVAQHNPPALVDLSEKMMKDLTGVRSNSVVVKFQVLEMGKGRSYRSSGTGYKTAMRAG